MSNTSTRHAQALPIGFELGPYILSDVLGVGGFGITYLAKDSTNGQQVVIKENLPALYAMRDTTTQRVLPHGAIEDFDWALNNFFTEAKTLNKLNHPGIVKVLSAFKSNETAYFVMPYLGGDSLDEWARDRQKLASWTTQDYLQLLRSLLESLGYLHQQGLWHRDIKPGNILLDDDNKAILIDFGSAKQLLGEKSQTLIESPGYTPFEQLQSHGNTGPWSDIYALGCTMYKLLTGETPLKSIDRSSPEGDSLIPLSKRKELSAFPSAILSSIDKAMHLPISKRWKSAEEWLHSLPEQIKPTPPHQEKQEKQEKTSRALAINNGISIAASIACLILMLYTLDLIEENTLLKNENTQLKQELKKNPRASQTTEELPTPTPKISEIPQLGPTSKADFLDD